MAIVGIQRREKQADLIYYKPLDGKPAELWRIRILLFIALCLSVWSVLGTYFLVADVFAIALAVEDRADQLLFDAEQAAEPTPALLLVGEQVDQILWDLGVTGQAGMAGDEGWDDPGYEQPFGDGADQQGAPFDSPEVPAPGQGDYEPGPGEPFDPTAPSGFDPGQPLHTPGFQPTDFGQPTEFAEPADVPPTAQGLSEEDRQRYLANAAVAVDVITMFTSVVQIATVVFGLLLFYFPLKYLSLIIRSGGGHPAVAASIFSTAMSQVVVEAIKIAVLAYINVTTEDVDLPIPANPAILVALLLLFYVSRPNVKQFFSPYKLARAPKTAA